ncbi:amidohydrolase [Mesorhizobium sp. L-8-10]|uniref:amidohydrolase family protein n=1 Tax=Mesorhizobium sp. L-8-10 TaxID=2744523 RepID=UPI0019385B05|nr:amidohydrolase family protein [Mesorhizobium sp. L-8-10]BCH34906.1 amidohydrolase [Mesorhizobium sp. L-8-10]
MEKSLNSTHPKTFAEGPPHIHLDHLREFNAVQTNTFHKLFEEIDALPIDDTHCHLVTTADAHTTPQKFLERIALSGFSLPGYFPAGVYEKWSSSDEETKKALDKEYGIQERLDFVTQHFSTTIFVKFLLKEMAQFLSCEPRLEAVVEARNQKGRNYWGYVNSLFRDANITNIMLETGITEGGGAAALAEFEEAIIPCRSHRISRIETIQDELFPLDMSFDDFEAKYKAQLDSILDGTGNYGKRTFGMKSYLLPYIGLIRPLHEREPAARSWQLLRENFANLTSLGREARAKVTKDLCRYTFTLALEECLKRDIPMQIHAGDGEPPGVILRNQDPFYLEEVVRFDRDHVMRMPKIIPLHAGYPSVEKAAWMSHIYPNCYFELSVMTPFVHQNLHQRYVQILEAVPISKILYASDSYNLPELYWLAGRWGKRYLARALADYVSGGALTAEEAVEAARMIFYKNNQSIYRMPRA